jgi:hypothetical protein
VTGSRGLVRICTSSGVARLSAITPQPSPTETLLPMSTIAPGIRSGLSELRSLGQPRGDLMYVERELRSPSGMPCLNTP